MNNGEVKKFLRAALLLAISLSTVAMAKRPQVTVRFHVEANPKDGDSFLIPVVLQPGNVQGVVEKMPALSERDVTAVYPVDAGDGTFGCVFQFDVQGNLRLKTFSASRLGSRLVAFVGTKTGIRQQGQWIIDKPINDGMIFVPRGFSAAEVADLKKNFRLIGHTAKPQ
jgi:hypothetical protein